MGWNQAHHALPHGWPEGWPLSSSWNIQDGIKACEIYKPALTGVCTQSYRVENTIWQSADSVYTHTHTHTHPTLRGGPASQQDGAEPLGSGAQSGHLRASPRQYVLVGAPRSHFQSRASYLFSSPAGLCFCSPNPACVLQGAAGPHTTHTHIIHTRAHTHTIHS